MEEFIQAAREGSLVSAKAAFESEMFSRIAVKTEEMRVGLGQSLAPFEEE